MVCCYFQLTGQPVLIGGTMGTCSYVLTGTEQGMTETFGTTCHGAVRAHQTITRPDLNSGCWWTDSLLRLLFQGRALSRAKSRRNLDFQDVLDKLADKGIAIRVASPKLVMEEVGVLLTFFQYYLLLLFEYLILSDIAGTVFLFIIRISCFYMICAVKLKGFYVALNTFYM